MATEAFAALAVLPDDVLAGVLRRLPTHSLAASRCVCKAWRAVVDEQQLLLPHLLPHSVRGLFVNYHDHGRPHFFARPTASGHAPIEGRFHFVLGEDESSWYKVRDHRNGLVLYWNYDRDVMYVCNPATRRSSAPLPKCPDHHFCRRAFLAFDPAVSPDYEVLLAPLEPRKERQGDTAFPAMEEEWPPSPWTWHVFSSRTRRWEERVFAREGDAAGTVGGLLQLDERNCYSTSHWFYATYWEEALYLHCRGDYISRLSLSNKKYQVIKSPMDPAQCKSGVRSFLGKSEKGVYFAAVDKRQLRVWILDGHGDQTEWTLKYEIGLKPDAWWGVARERDYHQLQCEGPWILDDFYRDEGGTNDVEWNSDDDDDIIVNVSHEDDGYPDYVQFLGFHPYKEVIFLATCDVAVAYHLNSSKVQYLGILKPKGWSQGVINSFVYTPSMIGGD